jgi:hypothetical protein
MSIYKKLLKIQKEVKGLSKDKKSHNYDYVTGNKLLSFIKPLMDENELILKQEVLSIENERQDYQVWDKWMLSGKNDSKGEPIKGCWKPKSEILSKVMMRFTWIDCESGERDENLFGANGQNDWEKGLGSALTYAERYFLLKYFHIATDEDDIDNPERKPKEEIKPKEVVKKKKLDDKGFEYLMSDKASETDVKTAIDTREMSNEQLLALTNKIEK